MNSRHPIPISIPALIGNTMISWISSRAAFEDRIKEFFPDGKITYPNIGVFTQTIHGKTFVKSVLDGGPAFKAGIMAGDEICSVDGKEYEPVKSFVKKTRVIARIQRSADPHSVKDIKVVPEDNSAAERYMAAMEATSGL